MQSPCYLISNYIKFFYRVLFYIDSNPFMVIFSYFKMISINTSDFFQKMFTFKNVSHYAY